MPDPQNPFETALAAQLQHPHILPVYDSGESAGRLWFTMPYVEGESLRDRLSRMRRLSLVEALRITREVARALQYAHEHGVVHRDIKPENILLSKDGSTLVADFGVARTFGTPAAEQLTVVGMVVGTPAYMSPEQATGEPEIDGRSDIYSLGCVLQEMLTGKPPFQGSTPQSIVSQHMNVPPPPVTGADGIVPASVTEALGKALAKRAVSPDRSLILDVRGHKSLWVYPVNGQPARQVFAFPDPEVRIDYPTWSPDGRWVLFDRAAPRGGDLWLLEESE